VWQLFGAYTYARVAPGTADPALEEQLATLADTYMTFGTERGTSFDFFAQPITAIHLHSHLQNEFAPNSRAAYVLLFGLVGLLVLGIACINFTNLATAQATQRVTEVGVRKAIGAGAGQVASRFLMEAVLLSLVALGVAFVLVATVLPLFNRLTGLAFDIAGFATGTGALVSFTVAVITGLAAGSYPSFYLSGFAPAAVLRGTAQGAGTGARRLRKGLVVVQFAASVVLVIGAAGVHQQLVHMQSANLGFEASRLVRIDNAPVRNGQITPEATRREIEALSGVEQMTMAMWGPSQMTFTNSEIIPEGRDASTSIVWTVMDPHYTETLDLEVTAGRSLMPGRAADSTAFLVNETAARRFGWNDPIGKTLRSPADDSVMGRVVGVVADMHFQSLQHAIEPAVFGLASNPSTLRTALVRLAPGDPQATLDAIAAKYRTWAPGAPFNYQFVDAAYDAKYTAEKQVRTLVGGFAGLTVLIACLGLFGLAAYAAERRTKEIGIRKALGATVANIVGLLSKEFLWLVGIACAVAVPVAYVGLQQWLNGFAYRIDVGPWLFVVASVGAAAIAWCTVSTQALRAAYTDPATALRDE
jgi:putative ABC transport system permease protein